MGATRCREAGIVGAIVIVITVSRRCVDAALVGVTHLNPVAHIAVITGERLAKGATDLCVACFHAIAGIAVITRGSFPLGTTIDGVAYLNTVAHISVIAFQRLTIQAALYGVTFFQTVASILIITDERLSIDAPVGGITGFQSVAQILIVAFERFTISTALAFDTALLTIAEVIVVALQRLASNAPRRRVTGLITITGIVISTDKGVPRSTFGSFALRWCSTYFGTVAEIAVVARRVLFHRHDGTNFVLRMALNYLAHSLGLEVALAIFRGLTKDARLELLRTSRLHVAVVLRQIGRNLLGRIITGQVSRISDVGHIFKANGSPRGTTKSDYRSNQQEKGNIGPWGQMTSHQHDLRLAMRARKITVGRAHVCAPPTPRVN